MRCKGNFCADRPRTITVIALALVGGDGRDGKMVLFLTPLAGPSGWRGHPSPAVPPREVWIMQLRFVASESTFDYFRRDHAATSEQHSKPVAFYSDQASIFRVNAKALSTASRN